MSNDTPIQAGTIARYLGKCQGCGKAAAINYDVRDGEYFRPDGQKVAAFALGRFWCECGKLAQIKPMKGTYNPNKRCDARCRNAKRAECECACGGLNHGGGFNLVTFIEPGPVTRRREPALQEIAEEARNRDLDTMRRNIEQAPAMLPGPVNEPPAPRVAIPAAPIATIAPPVAPSAPKSGILIEGFPASPYQDGIFDWIRNGRGDACVEAVAGSGKTTTLEVASKQVIKSDSVLFCCFNVHIKTAAAAKLPKHVKVSTIHGLGMGCLWKWARSNGVTLQDPRDVKYTRLTREWVIMTFGEGLDRDEQTNLVDDLGSVVDYIQNSLTDPRDSGAVRAMMDHFGLWVKGMSDEQVSAAASAILDAGVRLAKEQGVISYSDQLYLPYLWNLRPWGHDWVLVDEAQDLSPAQLHMAMKARRPGGRMLFVGDTKQAIMGFAGADAYSMQNIKLRTGAKELPLSICYRCPSSHVEMVKHIVPHIQARPGAPVGVIGTIKEEELVGRIREGDLVLCRTTAPVVKMCFEMISAGIPARVRGRKIGESLVAYLKKAIKTKGFDQGNMIGSLERFQADQIRGLSAGDKGDEHTMEIEAVTDKTECLLVIYRRSLPTTMEAFEDAIMEMFTDGRPSVMLSTIHRAKGLEERRVFLMHPELLPHPRATKAWELEQEANLEYVAKTRAKEEFYFVTARPRDK